MRKCLVTTFALVRDLAAVREPIRAKAFRTIRLERFFSCWRWIPYLDYHFGNTVARLAVGLLLTGLRRFVGLSPSLEEGAKRQKPGEVL